MCKCFIGFGRKHLSAAITEASVVLKGHFLPRSQNLSVLDKNIKTIF